MPSNSGFFREFRVPSGKSPEQIRGNSQIQNRIVAAEISTVKGMKSINGVNQKIQFDLKLCLRAKGKISNPENQILQRAPVYCMKSASHFQKKEPGVSETSLKTHNPDKKPPFRTLEL